MHNTNYREQISLLNGAENKARKALEETHVLKRLLAIQETWVRSLGGGEDPLEKEMATHSSILVRKISDGGVC